MSEQCPFYSQKRTFGIANGVFARGQKVDPPCHRTGYAYLRDSGTQPGAAEWFL